MDVWQGPKYASGTNMAILVPQGGELEHNIKK